MKHISFFKVQMNESDAFVSSRSESNSLYVCSFSWFKHCSSSANKGKAGAHYSNVGLSPLSTRGVKSQIKLITY